MLLVEDSAADVRLVREAVKESGGHITLSVARDGKDALDQLTARADKAAALPDLILLDLNMPRLDGREFLARIRVERRLRRLPIVVLTSSQGSDDRDASLKLGARDFVTKPHDLDDLVRFIEGIPSRWPRTRR